MLSLSFSTLIVVALVLAVLGIWYESARVRETANRVAAELCRRQSLQFLDGTVALAALQPRLGRNGLRLQRTYVFDYTTAGTARATGFIVMLGREVRHVGLESGGS